MTTSQPDTLNPRGTAQLFDIDQFVADCRTALAEPGSKSIKDVVARAVADPASILRTLGEPSQASAAVLFRAPDLTVLNIVWGFRQWTLPHNHNHRAIIGMYAGAEDNIFWRRLPHDAKGRVEAAGAESLRQGNVAVLGRDIIHSVTNPLSKLSMALHVYDGDFMADTKRSHWDAESLAEAPYDGAVVSPMFGQDLATPPQTRLTNA
jgi:predicted metal-dependent enzyme (double-stranded beta helix superfamily)